MQVCIYLLIYVHLCLLFISFSPKMFLIFLYWRVCYSSFGKPLLSSASVLHWGKDGEGEVMGDRGRGGAEEGEGRGCTDGGLGVVESKGSTGAALFESSDWADDLLL